MDFDSYVKNMTLKYKIALSIAVLRNKPEEISLEQYINQLQEKIRGNDIDNSICSENFLDEDFFVQTGTVFNDSMVNSDTNSLNLLENLGEHGLLQENDAEMQVEVNMVARSELNERSSFVEVLKSLKDIDENAAKDTQVTYLNDLENQSKAQIKNNADDQNKMICENYNEIFIDLTNESLVDHTNNNKIANNNVQEKMIANVVKNLDKKQDSNDKNKENLNIKSNITDLIENPNSMDVTTYENNNDVDNKVINIINEMNTPKEISIETNEYCIKRQMVYEKAAKIVNNIDKGKINAEQGSQKSITTKSNVCNDISKGLTMSDIYIADSSYTTQKYKLLDSQRTILYTIPEFSEGTSQISQSQSQNVEVSKKFIVGNKCTNLAEKEVQVTNIPNYSQNTIIRAANSDKIEYIIDENGNKYAVLHQIEVKNNSADKTNKNVIQPQPSLENPKTTTIQHLGSYTADATIDFDQINEVQNNITTTKRPLEKSTLQFVPIDKTRENNKSNTELNNHMSTEDIEKNDSIMICDKTNKETGDSFFDDDSLGLTPKKAERQKTEIAKTENNKPKSKHKGISSENDEFEKEVGEVINTQSVPFKMVKDLSRIKSYLDTTPKVTNEPFLDDDSLESTPKKRQKTNARTETTNTNSKSKQTISEDDDFETEVSANDEGMNSQAVPFKVIKELSRIKAHLARRDRGKHAESTDGYSTDSGYRSDSRSYKSAHTNDNWTHQAAYSLYNYIVQCPLADKTEDIVKEIALALGSLIDKMHEDEKYPVFLEELLSTVENILKEIYRETGCGDHILLNKDEKIQRLILLSKSTHILKYCLEKITVILQEIYSELTSEESLYELRNVQEIENISYIFYILEIILNKYMKVKDNLSQNTQNSQKILKKSSITDIWRKKWNFVKETKAEGSQEKVCVLRKMADVLNKIIVDCMDGYSLVSYSALKCFNILQSS